MLRVPTRVVWAVALLLAIELICSNGERRGNSAYLPTTEHRDSAAHRQKTERTEVTHPRRFVESTTPPTRRLIQPTEEEEKTLIRGLIAVPHNDTDGGEIVHSPLASFSSSITSYVGDKNATSGLPHGQGKAVYSDGSKYEGSWQQGERHGFGKLVWPDTDAYRGIFEHDVFSDHGTYVFRTGSIYIGVLKNGKRSTMGKQIWPDGRYFRGEYLNDEPIGAVEWVSKDLMPREGEDFAAPLREIIRRDLETVLPMHLLTKKLEFHIFYDREIDQLIYDGQFELPPAVAPKLEERALVGGASKMKLQGACGVGSWPRGEGTSCSCYSCDCGYYGCSP